MGVLEAATSLAKITRSIAELAKQSRDTELRNQIIELQSRLLELQPELLSFQQEKADLIARVSELEKTLQPEGELIHAEGVYWLVRDGRRDGPFCPYCRDVDYRIVHLTPGATKGTYSCALHKESFTTAEYDPPKTAIASVESVFSRRRLSGW